MIRASTIYPLTFLWLVKSENGVLLKSFLKFKNNIPKKLHNRRTFYFEENNRSDLESLLTYFSKPPRSWSRNHNFCSSYAMNESLTESGARPYSLPKDLNKRTKDFRGKEINESKQMFVPWQFHCCYPIGMFVLECNCQNSIREFVDRVILK